MIVPGQGNLSQKRYAKFYANKSDNSRQEMKAVQSTKNNNIRYVGPKNGSYYDSRNKIQVSKTWNVSSAYPNMKTRDTSIKTYY